MASKSTMVSRNTGTFVFVQETAGIRYWLHHDIHLWMPGQETKRGDGMVTFKADNGDMIEIPEKQASNLDQVHTDQLMGMEDICALVDVNEAALLHTVRVRYAKTQIYTRVARTLIAVNPFTSLPNLYGAELLAQYTTCSNSQDLPPHIYGIGSDAVLGLRDSESNQAVLISGESGAGKTESAKLIMSFVADAMRGSKGECMENVLVSNIVLENFGNAMTVRNNNSSRFGKWLDLHFSRRVLTNSGATLTSYLLETTRVVSQGSKERGYHVFFGLLQHKADFPDLKLEDSKKYSYLKNGNSKAPGIDDAKWFQELKEALTKFGVDDAKQVEIWTLLAAILNLGNVEFKEVVTGDGEGSEVVKAAPLEKVAELLQVDFKAVQDLMLVRKIVVGKDHTQAVNRADTARSVRDGLSRLIYNNLFLWLIRQMNVTLSMGRDESELSADRLLGVLDIAGFECFEHNYLEQLLINLSNEHLQQHFNDSMIKSETEECTREGVLMPPIDGFNDNADILELIDSKGGVLDLLDETCLTKFSSCTDLTFAHKVIKNLKEHKNLIVPKVSADAKFGIAHFAGQVTYSCDGWLEKNIEKLPIDLTDVLKTSELPLVVELAEFLTEASLSSNRRMKSVSSNFRISLKELMAKIHKANPHYIRCVKPNTEKVAGRFNAPAVMEQLLFGGMLAAVNIRQQGYAYRLPHADFVCLYACVTERLPYELSDEEQARSKLFKKLHKDANAPRKSVAYVSADPKGRATSIVEGLPRVLSAIGFSVGPECFAMGHTKVFTKFCAVKALDAARHRALRSVANHIQRVWRGVLSRRATRERREVQAALLKLLQRVELGNKLAAKKRRRATSDIGSNTAALLANLGAPEALKEISDELVPLLARAEALEFDNAVVTEADWAMRRLRTELSAVANVRKLITSVDIIVIEKQLGAVQNRLKMPDFPGLKELEERLAVLVIQVPLTKALDGVLDESGRDKKKDAAGCMAKLQEILERVQKEGPTSGGWLPELGGQQLVAQVMKELEDLLRSSDKDAADKLAQEREKAEEAHNVARADQAAAAKEASAKESSAKEAAKSPTPPAVTEEAPTPKVAEKAFQEMLEAQSKKMEEDFQKMMEEERKVAEAAANEKLEAEKARDDAVEAKEAAEQAMRDVEKKLMQKLEAERAQMAEELERRLKEVADVLLKEKAEAQHVMQLQLDEERAKVDEQKALTEERAAAEQAATRELKRLAEEHALKQEEFSKTLADERMAAKQQLADSLSTEREKAQKELEEKCAKERADAGAAATQEVKAQMATEHAEAAAALEDRLRAEHKQAEETLSAKLLAESTSSVQAFAANMSAERASAREEFEEKLAAVNNQLESERTAHKQEVQEVLTKAEVAHKLCEERAEAEQTANEKLQQAALERAAAEEGFKQTLAAEKALSEKELEERLAAEREKAQKELDERCAAARAAASEDTAQEVKDQMTKEHAEATAKLRQKLLEQSQEEEEGLADRLARQHAAAQEIFAKTMADERHAAEKVHAEKIAVAEKLLAQKAADGEVIQQELVQERKKVDDQLKIITEREDAEREASNKLKRLAEERAAAEEDFAKTLAAERKGAEEDLKNALTENRKEAEATLAERIALERAKAEKETADDVKQRMIEEHRAQERALERTLAQEHSSAEQELAQRLVQEHTAAQTAFARKMAAESERAQQEFDLRLVEEKQKADLAGQSSVEKLQGARQAARKSMEQELAHKMKAEKDRCESDFRERMAHAKSEAEREFQQRVSVQKRGRSRSLAVPGFKSERKQIVEAITKATDEYDVEALSVYLGYAAEEGLTDSPDVYSEENLGPIAVGKSLLNELQVDSFILDMIDELSDQVKDGPVSDLLIIHRLKNLLDQLARLQGTSKCKEGRELLLGALIDRCRKRGLRSCFDSKDPEEKTIASEMFESLRNFPFLKSPNGWSVAGPAVFNAGKRKSLSRKSGSVSFQLAAHNGDASEVQLEQMAYDVMLAHTPDSIAESLTLSPAEIACENFDSGASLNFINLTTWMGDRSAQELQRQSCHPAILDLAAQSSRYKDEIYMQVMKQLTKNTSARSQHQGWELLHHLVVSAPPSPLMGEFVRGFVNQRLPALKSDPETCQWAVQSTTAVLDGLKGNSVWTKVENAWDNVMWTVTSGGTLS